MTHEEAKEFLSELTNYEQQAPSASDLALQPIRDLLSALGNPHHRLAVVHVAGTNGKGSVAAMLDEMLRQAGFRTGLYTSPAFCEFEERVRVSGAPIAPAECADRLSTIRAIVRDPAYLASRPGPTYFDVVTALAFLHFSIANVDVAIIEVGLGGRSDSTNVCDPVLSIIASVSYDHTAQLGRSLAAIATEKAGIIKPGRPTISGAMPAEAREVITTACGERGSDLTQLGDRLTYAHTPGRFADGVLIPQEVSVVTPRRHWPPLALHLLGEHQAANAALAVSAAEHLRDAGFAIPDQAVRGALMGVRCPARIEVVATRPLVVLDCCHNPASAHFLIETLTQSLPDHMGPDRKGGRRVLVFGASRDKDLPALLAILAPHFDAVYFTSYTRSRRSATRQELLNALHASGVDRPASYHPAVSDAYQAAASGAAEDDFVCITGSVFLAGEFLSYRASAHQ